MTETLCECGCGEPVVFYKYKPRRFIKGHQMRGKNNSHWNGGICNAKKWYKRIWMPNHPNAHNNYVYIHRWIMEQFLGRYLKNNETVHHIDGDIHNNEISNLMLFSNNGEHMKYERTVDTSGRRCMKCGSDKTYETKEGKKQWYIYKNGFECRRCHRLVSHSTSNKSLIAC